MRLSKDGIVSAKKEYRLDSIIFATGFDAMTGSLDKIDIRGRNNLTLTKTENFVTSSL